MHLRLQPCWASLGGATLFDPKVTAENTRKLLEADNVFALIGFVESLRRAGKDPSREKLKLALESLHNYDLGGFSIDYSPAKRAGSGYVDLSIIRKDGQFLS
mgnify:FL=1